MRDLTPLWNGQQPGRWSSTFPNATLSTSWPHTSKKRTICAIPYFMGSHQVERVANTVSIGTTLNEHISWSPHTQNITSNAHASLSFLERNLRYVSQQLRERAYFTIARPALLYASGITDTYFKDDIPRFVTNNPRQRYNPDEEYISVTALLRDLN